MNLSDKITEAIKSSLPESVGAELKLYLAEAETNKKELTRAKNDLAEYREKIKSLEVKIDDCQKQLATHQAINEREKVVSKREIEIDRTIALIQSEEANRRADSVFDLAKIVFRSDLNKRIEKNINHSEDVLNTNGGYGTTRLSKNINTTISEYDQE